MVEGVEGTSKSQSQAQGQCWKRRKKDNYTTAYDTADDILYNALVSACVFPPSHQIIY